MAKPATTAQLRDDIDHGRTGSKIHAADPAAAPLGTDEEAAGTPPSGEVVQQARNYERAIGVMARGRVDRTRTAFSAVRLYLIIVLSLAALVAAGVWLANGA
jgi:hypothetical protein